MSSPAPSGDISWCYHYFAMPFLISVDGHVLIIKYSKLFKLMN